MKYKIPEKIFGVPIKGAMEKVLSNENTKPNVQQQPQNNNMSLGDFKILDKPILNYNWFDTHKELYNQGLRMLMPIEFLQLLNLARQKDKSLYEKITKIGSPSRYEWLDADFKVENNKLYVNTYHELKNGILVPKHSEPLQKCLMEDKTPGISLDSWIDNHTTQGFPLKNIPQGDLYYRAPMKDNNSVASFYAVSGGVDFDCGRVPSISVASLGVRYVRASR